MNIQRIDLIIIDDRPQSRTGQRKLSLRIFSLKIINVKCRCQRILSKIRQPQKCRKTDATHTAHQGTFLRLKAVREYSLVPHQMKGLIFITIISLLEYRHIICSAFMKITVILRIHRIDLQTNISEIFLRHLAGLANIFHIAFDRTLSGEHQNFFDSGIRNNLHFLTDLICAQTLSVNVIVAIKSTVYTIIFTVIGNV